MTYIKSYKELIVWQKSIQLVKEVFILTDKFPKSELYGLISQMRRAVIAIPSNIAEGYGRKSAKEYAQFYAIAYGNEDFSKVDSLLEEVLRMLNSMTSKTRSSTKLNARR